MKQFLSALLITLCANFVFAEGRLAVTTENNSQEVSTLDYQSYYFGRVLVNSSTTARFTVENVGDEPLEFVSADIWGMFFDARHNCRGGLQPGEKCQFEIRYWPAFDGYHDGEFQLQFVGDEVVVRAWGQAVDRW